MLADPHIALLACIGAFVAAMLVLDRMPSFDDLYLPDRFQYQIDRYGALKNIWIVFIGMDLPSEYRTYGLSRLLQLALWSVFGQGSAAFPLVVGTSQAACGVVIYRMARALGTDATLASAFGVIWITSPFMLTGTFHHYTYLILPFQLTLLACVAVRAMPGRRGAFATAAALGIACGLTGEGHLILAPFAIATAALTAPDRRARTLAVTAILSMVASIILHHLGWRAFGRAGFIPSRWIIETDLHAWPARVTVALASIPASMRMQTAEMVSRGVVYGSVAAICVAAAFTILAPRGALPRRGDSRREALIALLLAAAAALAASVFLAVGITTGQMADVLPRRYGFICLTLGLMAVAAATSVLARALKVRTLALTATVALVSLVGFAMLLDGLPAQRALDCRVIAALRAAASPDAQGRPKGVLFFVAGVPAYLTGSADGNTRGLLDLTPMGVHVWESPFGYYWTSQHFSRNYLGFRFAAMPLPRAGADKVKVGGTPYPDDPGELDPNSVVVAAKLEPGPYGIRIFDSFTAFEPEYLRQLSR